MKQTKQHNPKTYAEYIDMLERQMRKAGVNDPRAAAEFMAEMYKHHFNTYIEAK